MKICKNGHDLKIVGTYARNQCKKCTSDKAKDKYKNDLDYKLTKLSNAKKHRLLNSKPKKDWDTIDFLRFLSKVNKNGPNECWEWTGSLLKTGYGAFSAKRSTGKTWRAHRYSWLKHGFELKEGYDLCHSCDNRKCVNPNHLWLGTRQENLLDMKNKNRNSNWMKTHCKNRHEFIQNNIYVRYDGFKECKICLKESKKRWYEKNKKAINGL